jgi:hypothetical protein
MTAGRRVWFSSLCTLLLLCGCRNTNHELLESELRTKEIQYRELLDEHEKTEHHARALQSEIEALRKGSKLSPEQASQTFNTKRITLGRATGGQDVDNKTGDDALLVVVEPRDGSDHIIKTPGTLRVWVLEISAQGVKTPFSHWDIPPDELARSWKSNLLSNGYFVTQRWKSYPTTENLRLTVQLITSDGRIFEADRDIRVRLLPGAEKLHNPPLEKGPEFPMPQMHMPRPLDDQSRVPANGPSVTPASLWQAAPLDDAVKLQRPVPVE